jgi:hypothetical protein
MATHEQPLSPEIVHHIPLKPPATSSLTVTDLLSLALSKDAAIDVIERLSALHREERVYQSTVAFDEALGRCQAQLSRISADAHNPNTSSKYASYAKLDRIVRPIYTSEGFSVSYGEKDCPTPGKTRFVAYLSRSGVTREYLKDMTPSVNGPKGAPVMTQTHAEGAVDSYAKRYLLKDIFNIAVGEEDTDGNQNAIASRVEYTPMHPDRVRRFCFDIANAPNLDQLRARYLAAGTEAKKANDRAALDGFIQAKDARKRELR